MRSLITAWKSALFATELGRLFQLFESKAIQTINYKGAVTAEQYYVTQKAGTESPFHNEYWDNHEAGIYVDVVSGEPLFSSTDKFESGTGWPSFTKPLEPANIKKQSDRTLGMERDEIRSEHANSHLGHVFDDGPAPTGLRYCINSVSMKHVPDGEPIVLVQA